MLLYLGPTLAGSMGKLDGDWWGGAEIFLLVKGWSFPLSYVSQLLKSTSVRFELPASLRERVMIAC